MMLNIVIHVVNQFMKFCRRNQGFKSIQFEFLYRNLLRNLFKWKKWSSTLRDELGKEKEESVEEMR